MRPNRILPTLVGICLAGSASAQVCSSNLLEGAAVTVGSGNFNGAPLSTITDGELLGPGHGWSDGTVSWFGENARLVVTPAAPINVASLALEADNNDVYQVEYQDGTGTWHALWQTLQVDAFGPGLRTRPDPLDATRRYQLAAPVLAHAFRLGALSGDNLYAISEFQAFGPDVIEAELACGNLIVPDGDLALGDSPVISWTVTRLDGMPGPCDGWDDRVWLSTDATLDDGDVPLITVSGSGLAANEAVSRSARLRFPGVAAGTYHLIVQTNASGRISESQYDDNLCVSPPLDLGAGTASVDITGSVISAPDTIIADVSSSLTLSISNQGGATTTNFFYITVYLSLDDDQYNSGDRSVGFTVVPAGIAPGTDMEITLALDAAQFFSETSGTLLVRLDSSNHLTESDETNNELNAGLVEVRSPDLALTELAAPPKVTLGDLAELHWSVINQGNAPFDRTNFSDSAYLSSEPTLAAGGSIALLDYPSAPNLQPGEGYSRVLPVRIPHDLGPGPAYIIVSLDDAYYSPAGSELAVEVMLTTGTLPDLAGSSASGPGSAAPGEIIELNWSATNVGEEDVLGVWNDHVGLYNPSTDAFIGSVTNEVAGMLAMSEGYSRSRLYTVPTWITPGTYRIAAEVDDGHMLLDNNTDNNLILGSTIVVGETTTGPDVDLESLVVAPPNTMRRGDPIQVQWLGRNNGPDPIDSTWRLQFYLSPDSTWESSDRYMGVLEVSGLIAPGTTRLETAPLTVPSGLDSGAFHVIARADANNTLFESDEFNNEVSSQAVQVTARPDLYVTSMTADTVGVFGGWLSLSWTVRNQGESLPESEWVDRVSIYSSSQWWDVAQSSTRAALQRDEELTHTMIVPVPPGFSGTSFSVRVATDALDAIEEASEFNTTSRSIAFGRPAGPNLVPDALQSPLSATATVPFPITWSIRNDGEDPVEGQRVARVYLSTNTILDGNDVMVGQRTTSETLDPGTSEDATIDVVIPGSVTPASTNYLIVETNADRSVEEADYGDNRLVSARLAVASDRAADLVLVTDSVLYSDVSFFGDTITVDWSGRNDGLRATEGSWRDRIYLSRDATWDTADTYLIGVSNHSLEPGQSYQRQATGTLPNWIESAGTYYLILRVDALNDQLETREDNNDLVLPVVLAPQPLPDLYPANFTSTSTTVTAGESLGISWTVTNQGTRDATQNWYDAVWLSTDDTIDSSRDLRLVRQFMSDDLASGASYTMSPSVVIPIADDLPAGQYRLIFRTDDFSQVTESDNDNNIRLGPVITLVRPALPDLVVQHIDVPPVAAWGSTITVEWTVRNQGNAPATLPWDDRVAYGTTPTSNSTLLTNPGPTPPLPPGGSYTRSVEVSLPNRTGTSYNGIHYFHVIPDTGGDLAEASESNNQYGPVDAAYLYAAGSPDVNIESVTVPDTVVAGSSMTVSWLVRNIGSAAATGTWTDRVRLDSSNGVILGTFSEERTLQPSETYQETREILIPENTTPGSHRLYISTSAPGGNGLYSQYFEVEVASQLPDLVVAEVSLPTGPVAAGSSITVSWIDRNDGEAGITDSWRDRIYLSADDTLDATDPVALTLHTMTADLLPGEDAAASRNIQVPLDWGPTLYVFVVTDVLSNIVEAREDNNIGVSALLPINTFDVNLRPLAIRAPSTVAWGQSFTVEWDATNDGPTQIESRTWYDRIYLSTDEQLGGDTSLGYGAVIDEVLPSGGTYTRSLTVQTNDDFFLTAPRYLLVQVDGYDYLPESDEQDNVLAIPIELTPTLAPDLVVTTIAVPPTTHAQGQLALSWEVANQGTGPAPAWNDRIFLSSDAIFGSDDTLATLNSGQGLAVAETLQRTAGVDLSSLNLTPGQYWIFIQADPDDDIDEINDGNNRRMAGPFQVIDDPRPDLTVTAVNGPSTAASGETVTINWRVDNQGEVDATAPWVDRVYLSSDATWSTGDQFLGFLPRDTDVAAGAGYDQSLDIALPETSYELNRWIIVRTDADGVVPEIDELNNSPASRPITITVPDRPDLVIDLVTAPTEAVLGAQVNLTWTIRNAGGVPLVGPWTDRLWMSPGTYAGGDLLGNISYDGPPVPPGESVTINRSVHLPSLAEPGSYRIVVQGDVLGDLDEASDSNNSQYSALMTVTAVELPNLTATVDAPEGLYLFGQPTPGPIDIRIENTGALDAPGGWRDTLYLSATPTLTGGETQLWDGEVLTGDTLAPGQAVEREIPVSLPLLASLPEGTWYFVYRLDRYNEVPELDETDNIVASRHVTITRPPLPDLVAGGVEYAPVGLTGQRFELHYTVTNIGEGDASGNWTDAPSFGPTAQGPWTPLGDPLARPHDLLPGEQYQRTVELNLPATPGTWWVRLVADSGDDVEELEGEANNTAAGTHPIDVAPLPIPDLTVAMTAPPSDGILSGTEATISFQVDNLGTGATDAAGWRDSVFLMLEGQSFQPAPFCFINYLNDGLFLGEFPNPTYLAAEGAGDDLDAYIQTVTIRLPHDIQGRYRLGIYTDCRRVGCPSWALGKPYDVGEASETNNVAYTATFTVTLEEQPDLQVTSVLAPSTAFSGELITVQRTITNVDEDPQAGAPTDTGSWRDAFYLSTNDQPTIGPDDIRLDNGGVAAGAGVLAAGEAWSGSATVRLPLVVASGQYFIKCRTDVNNAITEATFEGNNIGVSPVFDVVQTPPPDLEMLAADADASGAPGQLISVTWSVRDAQSTLLPISRTWQDAAYLSLDTTFDPASDRRIASFSRTTQPTDSGRFEIPEYTALHQVRLPEDLLPGLYHVFVMADDGDALFEFGCATRDCNENNGAWTPSTLLVANAFADLEPATWSLSSSGGEAGSSVTLDWTVRNRGDISTPVSSWLDRIYWSSDQSLGYGDVLLNTAGHAGGLAPGETYDHRRTFSIPLVGTGRRYLILALDANNSVFEGGAESNNQVVIPFDVSGDAADLVVDSLMAPSNTVSGETVRLEYTISNSGNRATTSGSWVDRILWSASPDISTASVLVERSHSGAVAPGASYTMAVDVAIPAATNGLRYLWAYADGRAQLLEQNESNNAGPLPPIELSVVRRDAANLMTEAVIAPATAIAGQLMSIDWTVRNIGEATTNAPGWRDVVYLSRDEFIDPGDFYLGGFHRDGALSSAEAYTTPALHFEAPRGAWGPYFVIVRTDTYGHVDEAGRRTDNDLASTGLVQVDLQPPGDLAMGPILPPSFAMLGSGAPIDWSVENAGVTGIDARWRDALFLSTDPAWSIDDHRLGTWTTDPVGVLSGGASVNNAGAPIIPAVTPGEYYVVGRADVLNAIPETDEANNLGTSTSTMRVDATALVLGEPHTGEIGPGESQYFQFDLPTGETVAINLDTSGSAASIELLSRAGVVPAPGTFDALGTPEGNRNSIVLADPAAGTHYLLVKSSAAQMMSLSLVATTLDFAVTSVAPTTVGAAGTVTLDIRGAGFDDFVAVELIDADTGTVFEPFEISRTGPDQILARVNMSGVDAVQAQVIVKRRDFAIVPDEMDNPVLVEQVFDIAVAETPIAIDPDGGPALDISVAMPATVRRNVPFPIDVIIRNLGVSDALTPRLELSSPTGTVIAQSVVNLGGGRNELQLIPTGAKRYSAVLPGETLVLRCYGQVRSGDQATVAWRTIEDTSEAVAWDSHRASYLSALMIEDHDGIWNEFLMAVGSTVSELNQALRSVADLHAPYRDGYITGAEGIRELLVNAEARYLDASLTRTPSNTSRGPCQSMPEPACTTTTCSWTNRSRLVERTKAEFVAMNWTFSIARNFPNLARAFIHYIEGSIPAPTYIGPGSNISRTLAKSPTTERWQRLVVEEALKTMRMDPEDYLPACGETKEWDVEELVPIEFLCVADNTTSANESWQKWAEVPAGFLIGGNGVGQDSRFLEGTIRVTGLCDEDDECTAGRLEISTAFDISIIEKFDFCPGDPGTGLVAAGTYYFRQLDACGWDHAFTFQLDIQAPVYQAVYDSGQILTECCEPHSPPTCILSGPSPARGQDDPAGCGGGESGCDGETDGSAEAPVVNSSDPNIKVGPLGSGVERWVNADSPLTYRIGFENVPDATAPAAFVRIEDPLPTTLAPGSFRLGTIQFGDTIIDVPDGLLSYQTTVDLTSTRGVLLEITAGVDAGRTPPSAFWIFRSIDPLTGAPPADPTLGFLPPNDDSGAGQGWVGFTIRPASDIQHLDVITNTAEITFDANEPIITDPVFNTIDSIAPMSTLDPLPLVAAPGTAVPVTFRGTDDDTGSGLAGIRVLVSDEGGAYDSLVGFVQSESTTFIGEPGHVYRFASQAVDHARNYEPLMTYDDLVIAIPGAALDPSSDSGITGDLVTNDSTPLLIVTGAPNGNATITVEGVGRATRAEIGIGPDGKGIWQPETPLEDGDHNVILTSGGVSHVMLLTIDTLPPTITQWAFVTDHGPAGTAIDVIPAGGAYAEPRIDAPSRLRITLDADDRATDLAAILQPTLIGISEDGTDVSIPAPDLAVAASDIDNTIDISLPTAQLAPGRYRIATLGLFDIAGNTTPTALTERFFSVLPGDVTGDHRVNNTDLGAIAALTSEALIDIDNWFARRCDLNRDGYVNEADTQIAFPLRGHDLRFTPRPPSLDEDATPRAAQWNQPGLIADRTRPDHLNPLSYDQDDSIDAGSSAPLPSTAGSEFIAGQPLRREPGRIAILTPGHDLSLDGSHADNWTLLTTDTFNLDLSPGTYQSPIFRTRGNQPVLVSPELLVLLDDEYAAPDVTRQFAAAGLTLHLGSFPGTSKLLHVTTPFDHANDVLTLADAISRWPEVAACEPVMLVALAADLTPVRNPASGLVERLALDAAHTITRGQPTCQITILGSTSTATLASTVLTDQRIGITPDCTVHHEIVAHSLSPLGDMASTLDVARALTEATTRGDRIITIPGTLGARSIVLTRLFLSSAESGITLIAPDAHRAWPASLPAIIGVDAAQADGNAPPTPSIVHAPALTRSPDPDDHTGTIGTAVSTLVTAGVAALLQSWDDTLTPRDTAAALALGHDTTGTLTAWNALSAARLPGDTDFDGDVDITDLETLLDAWGITTPNAAADFNHDGAINFTDLSTLLAHWSSAPINR